MKLKMYLRMLLAAVAALFVATACDDSDDKTEPVGPTPDETPLTFEIAVSNIEGAKASLSVTPSNQLATYYWSAVKKTIFDDLGTDEAFLEDDMAFIQREATANQMTLSAYLQWVTGRGTATYTLTGLEAETEYYAYVYGIKTDGTVTTDVTKVLFTSGEGGEDPGPGPGDEEGPEMVLALTPGDPDGANTNNTVTLSITATNGDAVSGKYIMGEKAYIESQIATAGSAAELVKTRGNNLTAEWLGNINGNGIAVYNDQCKPGTEYMAIVLLANADGETVKSDSCSTTGTAGNGPEGSVALTAGNNGATDTKMTVTVRLTGDKKVASLLYFFTETAKVEEFLGEGISYEEMGDVGNVLPAQYVADLNTNKSVAFGFNGLTAGTSYTCVIKLTGEDGNASYYHGSASTTTGGGQIDGLKALIDMIAGHYSGGQLIETQTSVTVVFGVEDGTAVSGKYVVAPTASVQQVLDNGATYEQIVAANGDDFLEDELADLNGEGVGWYYSKLTPGTSYTAIVTLTDADGNSSTAYTSVSTEASGEVSDAYKAWLGTWTVTSTSAEKSNSALTFDITIDEKVAGTSYVVGGMFTAKWREDPDKYGALYPIADFDSETGYMTLANQKLFSDEDEDGAYDYLYNVRYKSTDGKTYVADNIGLIGLVGALAQNGESGQIVGNTLKNSSGAEVGTVTSMDYFYWYEEAIYGTVASAEFTVGQANNYPVGPYTIVKKAATGAPALRKASVMNGVQPKSLKLGLDQQLGRVEESQLGHKVLFLSERIFQTNVKTVRCSNVLFEGVQAAETEIVKSFVAVGIDSERATMRSARNK